MSENNCKRFNCYNIFQEYEFIVYHCTDYADILTDREDQEFNKEHNIALSCLNSLAKKSYEQRKYDNNLYCCGECCAGSYCLYREQELVPEDKCIICLNTVH